MQQKDRIRTRRQQLGLTQQEVARAVGVSEATVSRWESGEIAEVGSGKLGALAQVLQLDPAELLGQPAAGQGGAQPPDELEQYLEQLRTRPEMRAFFSLAKNATKSEVEEAMRIVEVYFAGLQAGRERSGGGHTNE